MHFAPFLLLLPLAFSAPAPSSDSSIGSSSSSSGQPLAFLAQSRRHSGNGEGVKRSVQVKVRRPVPGMAKRACQASLPIPAPVTDGLNLNVSVMVPSVGDVSDKPATAQQQGTDAVFPVSVKNSWTTVQGRSGSMSCTFHLISSPVLLLTISQRRPQTPHGRQTPTRHRRARRLRRPPSLLPRQHGQILVFHRPRLLLLHPRRTRRGRRHDRDRGPLFVFRLLFRRL